MLKISFRKVQEKDWDYILRLRNKDKFRLNFYDQHQISKQEHYDYLQKQQKNPNFFNWIICLDNENVGYVRILDNDVSIILDDKYHGQGIGTRAINLLEHEAKLLGIKKLVGKIMIDNKKSKKMLLNNNFKLKMYWYEKNLD